MTQNTPTPTKRVFVTGATTLVGREVVRHLSAAGTKVTGTTGTQSDAAAIRADGGIPTYPGLFRAGELRTAMTTLGRENLAVVNLAAQTANSLPFSPVDWTQTAALLVDGTAALLEAAKAAGVSYFLHGSFAFADIHSEDETILPALDAIIQAEDLVIQSGLPYSILRFGYIYGNTPDLQALGSALRSNRRVYTSEAGASAGWVHAADAAGAIAAALNSQPSGSLLNVVDDHAASPADFLAYFAQSQGLNAPSASALTAPLARMALGPVQYGLLNAHSHPANGDTKTLLGWQPRFTTFKQGVEDVLLSWRAAMKV